MPRFDTLLSEAGLNPACVQLVRHLDTRDSAKTTPYALWRTDRQAFETYQGLQRRQVFDLPSTLASFVVPPNGETLFCGIYQVTDVRKNDQPVSCPVSHVTFDPGTTHIYNIHSSPVLAELSGLMTIAWSGRNWVQRAHTLNRQVLEIRSVMQEQPFPGFASVFLRSDELKLVPRTWIAALAATGGVYLLVSIATGEQYVGSATGAEGLWSRWEAYARDGHGGNVLLRQRGTPPYWLSILETASSLASRGEIIEREQHWKAKLGSRAFGLNGN
jgi:hypothetical protein